MPFPPISWVNNGATAAYDWGSQATNDAVDWGSQATNDAVDWVGQAANDAVDWTEQAAKDTGEFFEDVGDGLEQLGEAYAEEWKEIGEDLADGFSKEGWMTQFMEEYVPAGGFVTAAVHAAAGNEDFAKAAAVKGLVTTIEAAASTAGTVLFAPVGLGPVGGVLGAGIGNAMGQLVEIAIVDELPPGVQHLFPPKTITGSLSEIGTSMLGGAAGAGAGKGFGAANRAYKKATMDAAEFAADQAVEKTTAQLIQATLMKKYLTTPAKPAIDAAAREAGLPVADRRLPPPEMIERITVLEQEALASALGAQRHLAEMQGATAEELQFYDRQIFSAVTLVDELKNDTFTDTGVFEPHSVPGLGTYFMRDGVIVWDESEIADANKRVELRRVGMTEDEVEQAIKDQWAERKELYGEEHADWFAYNDTILGDYMVKGDQVVFGTTDPEAAQRQYATEEANRRGFATLDEVEDAIKLQWEQRNELYGEEHSEWFTYTDAVMGEYMVKGDQVVFGTSDPEVAEQRHLDGLAQRAGWESASDVEAAIEAQWADRVQLYGVEHADWFAYTDNVMGEYMVKGDQIVFGTTDPDRAQEKYANIEAKKQGFESVDDLRAELVNSWQKRHEIESDSGNATGEWQAGGQSDIVGPYMVKDGQVVFGATTPEEAEELLAKQYFESAEPVLPDEMPVDENGMPLDDDAATIAELRAQIEALQGQLEDLTGAPDGPNGPDDPATERTPSMDGEPADEGFDSAVVSDDELDRMKEEAADDDGFDDGFDDFDQLEPVLPDEVPIHADGTPVTPPDGAPPGTDAGNDPAASVEMKPAVMPDDPMEWSDTPPTDAETAPEYVSVVMPHGEPAAHQPIDDGFTDAHSGAPAEPAADQPAEEFELFEEPASDPMNDPMNDPLDNPDEQQNR